MDSPAAVKALLDAGANIEARNKSGWTPLHMAARYSNSVDIVKEFLTTGANPKSNKPNTPKEPLENPLCPSPGLLKSLAVTGESES